MSVMLAATALSGQRLQRLEPIPRIREGPERRFKIPTRGSRQGDGDHVSRYTQPMTQPGADRPQPRGLTIGKLAELCGVHIETIRYYQRRGLLPEPQRPSGGYRQYPEALAHRLHFIRGAQDLGFTLREIEELLELGSHACEETRQRATRKIADIDTRIAGLQTMRRTLTDLVQRCHEGPTDVCAIHSRLADSESTAGSADRYLAFNTDRRHD